MGTADNQLQRKLDNATTPILGQGGITLAEQWDPEPVAYLSLAVPKMPNMFQLFGPNSAPVAGSISHTMEGACGFVIKCITKLQQEYLKSIVPRLVDLGLFFPSFPSPPPFYYYLVDLFLMSVQQNSTRATQDWMNQVDYWTSKTVISGTVSNAMQCVFYYFLFST
jgi:hypothetical protein